MLPPPLLPPGMEVIAIAPVAVVPADDDAGGSGEGGEEKGLDARLFGAIQGGRDELLFSPLTAGVLKQLLCWESLEKKRFCVVSFPAPDKHLAGCI